jgi:ABC-2 type transport system ATP-binding protein
VQAVRGITFTARPGRVCGFLGPNGAGKTTTLRCLLGLATPTSGSATFAGVPYGELAEPGRLVGAVIDPAAHHPDRSARNHLRVLQQAIGLPRARVDEVLREVELDTAADRRIGTFSLGMRQRLHLAAALLGDPEALVLDEPANGLDPAGMRWLRDFLRDAADRGRCVLLSSHQLHEVATTVDDVAIVAGGATVALGTLREILGNGKREILVRAENEHALRPALVSRGATVATRDGALVVEGLAARDVGRAALDANAVLVELREQQADLETRFFELTGAHG